MPTRFFSLLITLSEQVVPSGVMQCLIFKIITNKNLKRAEILERLREQFVDETLLRTRVYDWSKSFKEGRKKVENMRKLLFLQGQLWQASFWNLMASYLSIF
jgi:hypothetical protein